MSDENRDALGCLFALVLIGVGVGLMTGSPVAAFGAAVLVTGAVFLFGYMR